MARSPRSIEEYRQQKRTKKTVRTTITLPLSDYLVLWTLAKAEGKGIRELASQIVREYLEKKKWEAIQELE